MLTFIIPKERKLPERQVGEDAFLLKSRGAIPAYILPSLGQHPESSWAWPAVGVMTRHLPSPQSLLGSLSASAAEKAKVFPGNSLAGRSMPLQSLGICFGFTRPLPYSLQLPSHSLHYCLLCSAALCEETQLGYDIVLAQFCAQKPK